MDDAAVDARKGIATRSRAKVFALSAATLVALYLCYRLVLPFISAIVAAVTAAVITHRFSQWVGRRVTKPDLKAAICTGTVAVAILLPLTVIGYVGVQQVSAALEEVKADELWEKFQRTLRKYPQAEAAYNAVAKEFDPAKEMPAMIDRLQPGAVAALSAPVYVAIQLLLSLFILYFLYRDEEHALESVRSVLPLNEGETDRLLTRLGDTIHATIFGTVVVAAVQGAMGGIMFGLVGIPGAVLWGVIMGMLAIVPYLGTFVIWGPTAAYLALQGDWGRAIALAAWGGLAIGLIDNLLYPYLVGQRLRQHTVVAFFAILGGINLFGAMGVVLGPVLVAVTFFLLEVWRRRTAHGAPAERSA